VPQTGGDGEDWTDVVSRRRRARQQDNYGQDRQRDNWRNGGATVSAARVSRVRVSRRELSLSPERYQADYGRYLGNNIRSVSTDGRRSRYERRGEHAADVNHHYQSCLDENRRYVSTDGRRSRYGRREECSFDGNHLHQLGAAQLCEKEDVSDSALKRYVTFYFTNFPEQISYLYLRRIFEVCGIIKDVFVANKRNMNGEVYGFVRFPKVRDVSKLLQALNGVWFRQYRIQAKVVRFDRHAMNEVRKEGEKRADVIIGRNVEVLEGEKRKVKGLHGEGRDGEGEKIKSKGKVVDVGGSVPPMSEKGEEGEGVRVGEVLVRLGGETEKKVAADGVTVGADVGVLRKGTKVVKSHVEKQIIPQKLVHTYRSVEEDLRWARGGLVATVINGEAIPVIQTRISDVGFKELDIIPMGADKVFVSSLPQTDVSTIIDGAKDFFNHFFSSFVRWDKQFVPFQRGAWLRIYGILVHAGERAVFKFMHNGLWSLFTVRWMFHREINL